MRFYGIDPRDFSLHECMVKKVEKIVHPDFGTVVQLNTRIAEGYRSWVTLADTLHDPKTGQLLSSTHRLSAFTWGNLKLMVDDQ